MLYFVKKINIPVYEWHLLCSRPDKGTDTQCKLALIGWLASVIFHCPIFFNKPGHLPTRGGIAGCNRAMSDSPGLVE